MGVFQGDAPNWSTNSAPMALTLLFTKTEGSECPNRLRVHQLIGTSAVGGALTWGEAWYVWEWCWWGLWSRNSSGGDLSIPIESWSPPTLRSLHTQAAFLVCLPLSITSPYSTPIHTLTPICCHVSPSLCTYIPHHFLHSSFSPFYLLWPPPTLHKPGNIIP